MNITSSKMRRRWGTAIAISTIAAILMPPTQATAAAAAPDLVAMGQINNLIDSVRSQTDTYAGLWLDDATNTVYVATTNSSATPASVASAVARPVASSQTMHVKVLRVPYNFASLHTIATRVTTDTRLRKIAQQDGSTVSMWYPDPETDKVVIGFTKVTPRELAAVHAEYGSTARVITEQAHHEAIKKLSSAQAAALLRQGGTSTPKNAQTIQPSINRTQDTAPYYGGDVILYTNDGTNWVQCTSGYEFGTNSMNTAGHCGNDPTKFYQNGVYLGTTSTMQWGNGRIDMQLMTGSTYAPQIWTGSAHYTVSGSGGVAQGGHYCTDGAVTGQNCTAVVNAIDVCYNEGGVDVCNQDNAVSSNGTVLVHGGDSGGPVYTANSTSDPFAVGTISGTNTTGTDCNWSDMYEEKIIFGTSPAT